MVSECVDRLGQAAEICIVSCLWLYARSEATKQGLPFIMSMTSDDDNDDNDDSHAMENRQGKKVRPRKKKRERVCV